MEIQLVNAPRVFRAGDLPCVGEIQTLNVSRGCAGACVFCSARAVSGLEPGTVQVYQNLPYRLRTYLESSQLRKALPELVVVSSASDAFLGGDEVLRVTRQCLQILVNRGIGISISTRGEIPDDIIELFQRHADHTRVFIPLVSMDDDYTRQWEPGTALPRRRLHMAQRLMRAGIKPRIRLDPVIPYVNDLSDQIKALASAVRGIGLDRLSASFMHMREGLEVQMEREAPAASRRLVLGSFPWLDRKPRGWHHIARDQRISSMKRIIQLADQQRVEVQVCHCQNRDISRSRCPVRPPKRAQPQQVQSSLFE